MRRKWKITIRNMVEVSSRHLEVSAYDFTSSSQRKLDEKSRWLRILMDSSLFSLFTIETPATRARLILSQTNCVLGATLWTARWSLHCNEMWWHHISLISVNEPLVNDYTADVWRLEPRALLLSGVLLPFRWCRTLSSMWAVRWNSAEKWQCTVHLICVIERKSGAHCTTVSYYTVLVHNVRTCGNSRVHYLRQCAHCCNEKWVARTRPETTPLVSWTVVVVLCALPYCTKMSAHYAPELRDGMQASCTVPFCMLLCSTVGWYWARKLLHSCTTFSIVRTVVVYHVSWEMSR